MGTCRIKKYKPHYYCAADALGHWRQTKVGPSAKVRQLIVKIRQTVKAREPAEEMAVRTIRSKNITLLLFFSLSVVICHTIVIAATIIV